MSMKALLIPSKVGHQSIRNDKFPNFLGASPSILELHLICLYVPWKVPLEVYCKVPRCFQGSHSTWKNDESFSSHGNIMEFCKISWKNEKKPGKMRISVHSSQQVFSLQNVIFFQMIGPLKITCIRH